MSSEIQSWQVAPLIVCQSVQPSGVGDINNTLLTSFTTSIVKRGETLYPTSPPPLTTPLDVNLSEFCSSSAALSFNKKAQLWLRNPRDTTAFQIHPDEIQETMMIIISVLRRVETNIQWVYYGYIQLEIRYLVTVSFVFEL